MQTLKYIRWGQDEIKVCYEFHVSCADLVDCFHMRCLPLNDFGCLLALYYWEHKEERQLLPKHMQQCVREMIQDIMEEGICCGSSLAESYLLHFFNEDAFGFPILPL